MKDKTKRRVSDRQAATATVIGDGMAFHGRIKGRGNVIVAGDVESDCEIEGVVTLTDSGYWKGTIVAEAVVIAGKLIGDVRASGQVEVSRNANVKGSLVGAHIAVAEGAVIDGAMRTTTDEGIQRFRERRGRKG